MAKTRRKIGDLLSKAGIHPSALVKFVRFGGPVGKLTLFGIAVLAVLFTIATRIDRAELLTLAWIVLIIAVAVIVSIITFALKHPEYATLEGMEAVTMSAQLGTNKGLIRDITPEAREKGPNPLIIDTDATSTN